MMNKLTANFISLFRVIIICHRRHIIADIGAVIETVLRS